MPYTDCVFLTDEPRGSRCRVSSAIDMFSASDAPDDRRSLPQYLTFSSCNNNGGSQYAYLRLSVRAAAILSMTASRRTCNGWRSKRGGLIGG